MSAPWRLEFVHPCAKYLQKVKNYWSEIAESNITHLLHPIDYISHGVLVLGHKQKESEACIYKLVFKQSSTLEHNLPILAHEKQNLKCVQTTME